MTRLSFQYVAMDKAGAKLRGQLHAASKAEAVQKVSGQGLTPLVVEPLKAAGRVRHGRVSAKDVAHFTYQFSTLINARLPLSEGLLSIAEQEQNQELRRVLTDVASRIEAGETIADSMSHHPRVFSTLYIETIRAAEKTGSLGKVLEMLSDMLERQRETEQQIKSAMMYPAVVMVVLGLAVTFLIAYVIPKFARMFAQRGVDLPLFTRILMGLGESVQTYWYAYLAGVVAAVFFFRAMWARPAARRRIEDLMHKIPAIGEILSGLAVARFCRVLGLSVRSGVSLIDALDLAGRSSGRARLIADAGRLCEQVRTGGRLRDALSSCAYLPVFARRMLSAGEESGELPTMCSLVSRHYERETGFATKNITTVIEPVMVVLIAGVVLVVALAIFLPMWDMVKLVS